MSNTIATRVQDFLADYPPFNLLEKEALQRIAASVVVQYFEPNQIVFRKDEPTGPYFFIIREGAIQLWDEEGGERFLVDELEEGDILGVRPLLAEQSYAFDAVVREESLLYAIPIAQFTPVLQSNPKVTLFLARSMAVQASRSLRSLKKGKLFLEQEKLTDNHFRLMEIQCLERSKKPVTCAPEISIQEAAHIMTRHEVGSIIISDTYNRPLGIVTDRDLRKKVVTGLFPGSQPVSAIMSSPVITVAPTVTVADVQIEMVRNRIHHLCITADGSPATQVMGVLSEHDLLVLQGNNPAILVRETLRSQTPQELRQIRERSEKLLENYIYQEVSIAYICNIMSEINDVLTQRAIALCIGQMREEGKPKPDVDFDWLTVGSGGRQEQLLRTDQDSALVFANVPEQELEAVRAYFVELAQKVTEWLYEIGFEYCPGKMMASNPQWCKSLSEWKKQFSSWIHHPDPQNVRYCTIFIDYRPVFGAGQLTEKLTRHIFLALDENPGFLSFLAKSALENPPPLSFFRNFVVERSGEHKDNFDVKKRAMMPLADAARVLTLEAKMCRINNTFNRFEKLAVIEPQNQELYEAAAEAYEILIRYRTLQGLKNKDSGRYFKIEELSKMERLNLRNSFQPIRELQNLLSVRFQVSFLR